MTKTAAGGIRELNFLCALNNGPGTDEEVLRDYSAAAVAIVTRREHHAAQVLAASRASNEIFKDIFIEKPLVLTANYRPDISRAANAPGRRLTLCYHKRFAPFYEKIKKISRRVVSPLAPPGGRRSSQFPQLILRIDFYDD